MLTVHPPNATECPVCHGTGKLQTLTPLSDYFYGNVIRSKEFPEYCVWTKTEVSCLSCNGKGVVIMEKP